MGKFFERISRAGLILAAIGIFLLCVSVGDTLTSFKGAKSFEDVVMGEEPISAGDHIQGQVPFLFDYFAIEQTWTENKSNNSVTPKKTSKHYYVLPCGDIAAGLAVGSQNASAAKDLADQTYGFLSGGSAPTAELILDARVAKMDDELAGMFREELTDVYGYTDQEIEDMGTLLMIEPRAFTTIRVFTGVGAVMVLLGAALLVRRWKRVGRMQEEAEVHGDMFT